MHRHLFLGASLALALTVTGCDSSGRTGNHGNGNGNQDLSTNSSSSDLSTTSGNTTDLAGVTPDLANHGAWSFGNGWQPPDAGTQPPLVGNGTTTVVIGPGADSSSSGKFGGSGGAAPTIVYPASGVVVPPNMNALEFHFIPAPGQTLFKLSFHAPTMNLDIYTGCTAVGGGCVYATDMSFWSSLVPYARGTAAVSYTVSGVSGASPGAVGTSAPQTIAFADQDLTGGIYYWNTGGVIERYDFGLPGKAPQAYLTAAKVGAFACVGCHVVSRQGARIAAGKDIPAPAAYTVFDVASTTPLKANGNPIGGGSNFSSFSPDGNHLLISDGSKIGWQELYTGSIVNASVVASGTMPDWSPDGAHMVYAKPNASFPIGFANPGVSSASIETLHFNGLGWDTPSTLVPFSGENNYYPAYAPTGDWVVFNRSPKNADSFSNAAPDQDAGTTPDGELWVVAASGGTPIRLSAANNPGNCQWPKWAPVVHSYYGGKILWLTFSSDRAYGLRLATGQQTQLWMIGFDPAKAAAGEDPSLPGFWLPFQDLSSGNHIAQWATEIVRKPCSQSTDCASGEICRAGKCVPQ